MAGAPHWRNIDRITATKSAYTLLLAYLQILNHLSASALRAYGMNSGIGYHHYHPERKLTQHARSSLSPQLWMKMVPSRVFIPLVGHYIGTNGKANWKTKFNVL